MILIPVNRTLSAASICNENKILFCHGKFCPASVYDTVNGSGGLFSILYFKPHVGHCDAEAKLHSRILQIAFHGQDEGLVLIIAGKFKRRKIRQAADMVDKATQIQFHFQGAVPVFKGKHRAPVEPERRVKYFFVKYILNGLIKQILISCEKKLHDLAASFFA